MGDPKKPVSGNTQSVGFPSRLVQVQSVTPDGQTAICVDRTGAEVRVPMLIQRSKGALPAAGEWWVIAFDISNTWTFAAIASQVADPFPPQPGKPASIPGSAIEPGTVTGKELAVQTVSALNLAANAAGTNIILDPQFTSGLINSSRLADAGTSGGWSPASPNFTAAGAATCTLALMPSDMVPLYVNSGEQYYLSVSVTLSSGTANAGIQFVFDNGSDLGPVLPISAGPNTVAQLVTIPPGVASTYVRLIVTDLPAGATAQFTLPVCYITIGPSQVQAGAITANSLAANSVDASKIVANSITAAQLAVGIVVAGIVDATQITAATLAAGNLLIYSGTPGPGTLVGSFASAGGTDQFGNAFPTGVLASQGAFQGMSIDGSAITGSTHVGSSISQSTLSGSTMQGGTVSETTITFDQVGGLLLVYGTTTTTVTLTDSSLESYTMPAGNYNQAKIECWGAGSGGSGGGSSRGGETGGGGEYSCEPSYPVMPGQVVPIQIGQGGGGAPNGYAGDDGGDTLFDNGGVFANGGHSGGGWYGGSGGGQGTEDTPSTNTIHHPGGNGADSANYTGGSSGGNSGNPTGAGNSGFSTGGAWGAGAPTPQTGSGEGGAGGNPAADGANGTQPGGAGGGAGAGSATTSGSYQYRFSDSATYKGMNATSGPGNLRMHGTMYQGGTTASGGSANGDMNSLGLIGGNPVGDLSGKTIDRVSIRFNNQHSWYSTGMYLLIGYANFTYLGGNWNGGGVTHVAQRWINEYATTTFDLSGLGLGSAIQSGAAKCIALGYNGQPSYDLWNYGYMYGAGGSNSYNPLITITWHTGTPPTWGGNGGDGQIKITYVSSQVLVGAIAPVAGADAISNAYAAGWTGPVQNFEYASAPSAVETWHSLTPLPSGLTGSARYKLVAEHNMLILDVDVHWTTTSATTFTLPSLPAGYGFSNPAAQPRVYTMSGNATVVTSSNTALGRLYLGGGNGVQVIVPATTGGGDASCTVIVPQD